MSDTIVKVDNLLNTSIYFFQSKFVKIYPAGFRGTYGSDDEIYYFDPESNIPTEFNLTKAFHKLPNMDNRGYIIGLNSDNELEVVLDGYYFKISNFVNQMDPSLVNTKLSLIWSLEKIDYELPDTRWDNERSTSILKNLYKYSSDDAMGYNLDLNSDLAHETGSYIFTGIALIKTEEVDDLKPEYNISSLPLGTYNSNATFTFEPESYSIFQTIQHGKGDYSLRYNDDTNSADGNYSFAGGKSTKVSNDYGFGFGFHVTAKNNTRIAFGEYNKNEDYFEIGRRGINNSKRNIFSVTENGNVKFTGSLSFLDNSAYIDTNSFKYRDLVSGTNTGNGWGVVVSTKSLHIQSDNTSLINTYGLYLSAPTITANGDVSVTKGLTVNNKITGKGALEINGEATFGTDTQYVKLLRGNVIASGKIGAKSAYFNEIASARVLRAVHRIEVLDEKDAEGNITKEHAGLRACQAKIDRNLTVNGFAEINGVASGAITLERVKTDWKPTGTWIAGTKSNPSIWRPGPAVEVTTVIKRECYSEDCGLIVKRKILNGNGIVTLGDIDAQYGDVKSLTSTVLEKLTVADKTIISSSGITANDITCDSFYSKSINTPSDIRLKENIVDYKNTNSILDLNVKQFNYINNPKTQIGFIAQDVQKLFPELVEADSNGFLGIKETKLVYLLLDEVKKLRKEIDELKK